MTLRFNRLQYVFLILSFFVVFSFPQPSSAVNAAETTRYGACLIRSELGPIDPLPQISFTEDDLNAGWKVVQGEAYTGIDAHRLYLTVEAPGAKIPAPLITVKWADVKIERILGAEGFQTTDDGVQFKPTAAKAPTGSFTEVSFGAVRLGIFHNWDVRRCGPYRDDAYPDVEIRSHLNYLLAALEICRAYGWTDTSEPDFKDHINLYGFETHFPNGHRDFPAHFHIMLEWDRWTAVQVGHYLLDPQGNIVKNTFWSLHKDIERPDRPGVTTPYLDKTDRLIFETTILDDGSGLVVSRPEDDKEYLLRSGKNGAAESVEVCSRSKSVANEEWSVLCEVKANDNVPNGVFSSEAIYTNGSVQKVEFRYDPDTGARLDK